MNVDYDILSALKFLEAKYNGIAIDFKDFENIKKQISIIIRRYNYNNNCFVIKSDFTINLYSNSIKISYSAYVDCLISRK